MNIPKRYDIAPRTELDAESRIVWDAEDRPVTARGVLYRTLFGSLVLVGAAAIAAPLLLGLYYSPSWRLGLTHMQAATVVALFVSTAVFLAVAFLVGDRLAAPREQGR